MLDTAHSPDLRNTRAASARRTLRIGASILGLTASAVLASHASAQVAPPPNIVGACSGVSLPRSVVTDILSPVVTGIVTPIQNTVNPILGVVGAVLPLVPPLNIDAAGLLANAAAGNPVTLQVLNANGTIVGPADRCDSQADGFTLRTPRGIAIGGNRITGLGSTGLEAVAGEANSIAFGNAAATDATAAGAIAFGSGSNVGANATGAIALGTGATATGVSGVALGAGSVAARGPLAGYSVVGLTGAQTSAGEVSVGAAGVERQITNVAAGSAPTDAVNVGQLAGVQAQIGAVATGAVLYDGATRDRVTLTGANGTVLANVAAGSLAAGSTEAVNGGQLSELAAIAVQFDDQTRTRVSLGGVTAAAPVALGNVAAGTLTAGSTDAVNGGQLFATNTAVTNLTTNITNGAVGALRYSNAATPTVPNGGVPSNDVTLVGVAAGAVGLRNVANGVVAAGSTDAVNGGQLAAVSGQVGGLAAFAVQYDDTTRTRVTLGGAGAAPVALGNVAAGTLAVGSTSAVNGGQLVTLGTSVAASLGGQSAYDAATNSVLASIGFGGVRYGSVQSAFDAVDGAINGGAGIRYFRVLSTRADGVVTGTDSLAIGPEANASAANSVALGTGSTAVRGASAGYAAVGLAGLQSSAGEVSVGSAGAARQITNVAAGTAATDAANVGQVAGVAAQVAALGNSSVQYDDATRSRVTLGGAGGTTVTNVAAGTLAAGSSDAVNGAQLFATNTQVAINTAAITNLGNQINSGGAGPVQYSNPGSPTTPNGGVRTNDLTLVGAAAAPVALHNVAGGSLAAGSTDAVNGGQLNTTNQAVTAAQGTANTALALGSNSVQYGPSRTNVTFNAGGTASVLSNVAAGVSATDAANVGQLSAGVNSAITQSNAYTDSRIAALGFDLRNVRKDGSAGTSGALAAAGLPQAYEAGKGMIAIGGGTYGGQTAFALGVSKAFDDGHTVMKLSGTYDSQGRTGASGGIGYQF